MKTLLTTLMTALAMTVAAQNYTPAQQYALKRIAPLQKQVATLEQQKAKIETQIVSIQSVREAKEKSRQNTAGEVRLEKQLRKQTGDLRKQINDIGVVIAKIRYDAQLPPEKKK